MSTAQNDEQQVLTVDEAARLLRISRGLAFAAVRSGDLPSIRIGRRILVPRRALEEVIRGAWKRGPDPRAVASGQ